jgi:hypothetical protein
MTHTQENSQMFTQDQTVYATVNHEKVGGVYIHRISGKKNRHCIGVKRADKHRLHWITVSSKKLTTS